MTCENKLLQSVVGSYVSDRSNVKKMHASPYIHIVF